MTLFLWILFGIAVIIPMLAAIGVSLHDISTQRIKLLKHASRRKTAATVLIYHSDISATRRSIRQLRRLRSLHLSIVVVTPAGATLDATLAGVRIYQPERTASRQAMLASACSIVDPKLPLLIINSGDIMPAMAIHTSLRQFHIHPRLAYITIHGTRTLPPSFHSILLWFGVALHHTLAALRLSDIRRLPSGTWIRAGELLSDPPSSRNSIYISSLSFTAADALQIPAPSPRILFAELFACATAIACYGTTLVTGLTLPIIGYWIVTTWWLATLAILHTAKRNEKVTAVTLVPLAGIIIPVWHLIILVNALLQRLRQHLPRTRRQHIKHGVFFRLRHP